MTSKTRRTFSASEKAAIVKRHLVEGVAVSGCSLLRNAWTRDLRNFSRMSRLPLHASGDGLGVLVAGAQRGPLLSRCRVAFENASSAPQSVALFAGHQPLLQSTSPTFSTAHSASGRPCERCFLNRMTQSTFVVRLVAHRAMWPAHVR